MVTTEQIKHIHTLLSDRVKADKELKQQLICQFTGDENKASTKDLTFIQANELIYLLSTGKMPTFEAYATFDKNNKSHMYMLSLCRQINWTCYSNKLHRVVVDLNQLGEWMKEKSFLHKPLMAYSKTDLVKLVSQLEIVVQKELSKK
jgi:hypothetical protein